MRGVAHPDRRGVDDEGRVVKWQRMPLPISLNHINLWAIEDGAGWTLVDTGMKTSQTAATWETILAGPLLYFAAVHMVFVSSVRYRVPGLVPALALAAIGARRVADGGFAGEGPGSRAM